MEEASTQTAVRYVRSIRNGPKRRYAQACVAARLAGQSAPERPDDLSVMGAQAVQMRLAEILKP